MEFLNLSQSFNLKTPTVVTVGKFDGLHKGHMSLLDALKKEAEAKSFKSVVITFKTRSDSILTDDEKAAFFTRFGIDYYAAIDFSDDFLKLSAQNFISEILINRFNCQIAVAGENFRFGFERQGDIELLKQFFNVICVPLTHDVSSEKIRKYIRECDFETANELLGYPYFISGTVSHGKKEGRKLGFPTINIMPLEMKLIPDNGVYATKTLFNGKTYKSLTNIGTNPTLNGTKKTIETFILDFDGELYGEAVEISFYRKIRGEIKFDSAVELQKQIEKDISATECGF